MPTVTYVTGDMCPCPFFCSQEDFFLKFAEFEEKVKEVERARAIYKYALDHIPKAQAENLYARFVAFEKQHGDREGIEEVVISKRRWDQGCGLWADAG